MESILKLLGFPLASGFAITAKVSEQEASQRYEKEIMEFGASSPMFTHLATIAMLNLFCFLGVSMEALISEGGFIRVLEKMALQIILCVVLVLINAKSVSVACGLLITSFNWLVITFLSYYYLVSTHTPP